MSRLLSTFTVGELASLPVGTVFHDGDDINEDGDDFVKGPDGWATRAGVPFASTARMIWWADCCPYATTAPNPLIAILAPFAAYTASIAEFYPDASIVHAADGLKLTAGDFRRLAAAFTALESS